MAREGGGGGGAFGWTLLGILVGVAGTLAVETLLTHQQPARQVEEQPVASSASVAVATAAPVAPKPVEKPAASAAAPVKATAAAQASQEDVEDDAAAAGMTSRSHPDQSAPN